MAHHHIHQSHLTIFYHSHLKIHIKKCYEPWWLVVVVIIHGNNFFSFCTSSSKKKIIFYLPEKKKNWKEVKLFHKSFEMEQSMLKLIIIYNSFFSLRRRLTCGMLCLNACVENMNNRIELKKWNKIIVLRMRFLWR